jgi:LPS export ABC transporter protein LptC
MKKKITIGNIIIFLIFLLAFSLILTIVINYQRGEQDILPDPQSKKVDIALNKITLTNTENGITSWKLAAESVDFDTRLRKGHLKKIRVTFLGGEEGDLILTADEGEFTEGGELMTVRGNVVVRGEQGYTFFSNDLEYRKRDDLISTESSIRFVADGLDLKGRGLRFKLKDRSLRILQKVDANIAGIGNNTDD